MSWYPAVLANNCIPAVLFAVVVAGNVPRRNALLSLVRGSLVPVAPPCAGVLK